MGFQAFVDDSLEHGEVLVLAGYIASDDCWAEFSKIWRERLHHARWESLHMAEIGSSRERMEIAGWFYRAIEDHLTTFVAIAVEIEPLKRVITELGFREAMDDPGYLDNPYILAFRAITDFTAQYQHELGITEPIDFIFDNRSEKKAVCYGFEIFKNHCRQGIRGRVGLDPTFKCDKDYPQLQAADLLAWHVRKHWIRHRSITGGPLDLSWPARKEIRGYCFNMDYPDIKAAMSELKANLVRAGYRGFGPILSINVTFSSDLLPREGDK